MTDYKASLKHYTDRDLLEDIWRIMKRDWNRNYDRIPVWIKFPANAYKTHRYLMPTLIRYYMKENSIVDPNIQIILEELDLRIAQGVFMGLKEDSPVKLTLWQRIKKLIS